jgi:MATE family multidrug resistance protein
MKTYESEEDELFKPANDTKHPSLVDFSFFSVKRELKELLWLSGPAIVAQSSFILMNLTDSIFIGGVGTNELAAVALGNSLFFCLVYLGIGLSFGLDTLLTQSYGANQMRTFGIYLQTSFYVVTVGLVPICVALWYTEDILLSLGQDPRICGDAGTFSFASSSSFFFSICVSC